MTFGPVFSKNKGNFMDFKTEYWIVGLDIEIMRNESYINEHDKLNLNF